MRLPSLEWMKYLTLPGLLHRHMFVTPVASVSLKLEKGKWAHNLSRPYKSGLPCPDLFLLYSFLLYFCEEWESRLNWMSWQKVFMGGGKRKYLWKHVTWFMWAYWPHSDRFVKGNGCHVGAEQRIFYGNSVLKKVYSWW